MHKIITTIRRPRRIIALFMVTITVIVASSSPAMAQEINAEQRAALYARPAVVYLEHNWQVWIDHDLGRLQVEFSGSCTGFVVEENGYIVSAGHCVDPGPRGSGLLAIEIAVNELWPAYRDVFDTPDDLFVYGLTNWEVEGLTAGSTPTPETLVHQAAAISGLRTTDAWPARVIDFQPLGLGDVALLKTEQRKLPAIELRDARDVNVGLPVLSIGYPGSVSQVTDFNFEPTFKNGQISSTKSTESFPVFEISAPVSQGMSGGPTIDLDGRVVGVNSFGPGRESQPFNFISSVDLVSEMLNRNGVTAGLGPIDATYRAGVDAFLAGDYSTAIARFDEVIDRSPSHSQSMDLRTQAEDALADQDVPQSDRTAAMVAIAVIVLLAAGYLAHRKGILVTPTVTLPGARRPQGTPGVHDWAGTVPSTPASTRAVTTTHAPPSASAAVGSPAATGWWTELPTTSTVDS